MKRIIINADDYGFCDEVDDGVVKAVKEGYVNSVAAFSNAHDAEKRLKRLIPLQENGLNVGLHLTITSGRALSDKALRRSSRLTNKDGHFYTFTQMRRPILKRVRINTRDEVRAEIEAQIQAMKDANLRIDHLSSHHDALTFFEDYFEILLDIAQHEGIPVRSPKMLPTSKEIIYYKQLLLRLSDNMTKAGKIEIRAFKNRKQKWFLEKMIAANGAIPKGPDAVDGSNYVTRSQIINVRDHFKQELVAMKKAENLCEQILNQPDDKVHEYCLHLCDPEQDIRKKSMQFNEKDSIHYYPGVNSGYFDGRAIEYKSLQFLHQNISRYKNVELINWAEI